MNPAAPFRLTFCSPDDDLLRVWGVADRERYEYIESILEMVKERLADSAAAPKTAADVALGSLVLVKQGQQFKRGLIIRHESGTNSFKIRLLDVGGTCNVTVDDIRTTNAIPHLRAIGDAPCAQDYILGDSLVRPNRWSMDDINRANRVLRVHTDVKVLCTVAGLTLISWDVLDRSTVVPFSSFLVAQELADYASPEMVSTAVLRKCAPPSQFPTVPPPKMPQTMFRQPYAQPDMMSPPTMSIPRRTPPGLGVYPRPPPPRAALKPEIRLQQFKVETLPVGSHHEVYVCHVIEGAQSFMIQLKKNVDEKLGKLMARINDVNFHPEPINQIFTGLMCLGRFSEDNTLCRAVVSMVLTEGANLLFVDFGNSETVPFDAIFKIPPQFFEEPIMALGFTLAGLSPPLCTEEARRIFEDLVMNADSLLLSVTKPEIHLKQYCELYIRDNKGVKVSVKQMVLDKVKQMKPAEYKRLSFKQNSWNDVIVSYVESPTRFFVQLEANQPLLDTLMASVEEYCLTSTMKEFVYIEDVNENMAVCCPYSVDNKWYRGLIADEPLVGEELVVVFYVDYGNQDTVPFSKLRIMNHEMISQLPMQAVQCCLDIDIKFALREDVIETFVDLVDTKTYKMKVINVLPENVLLVNLFDENDRNIKDVLMSMFGQSEELVFPLADHSAKSAASQGSGNWRERKTSSNDGDFTAFRREDQQQRSRGKSDSQPADERGRRSSDYKRQDSRGVDETDDAARFSSKENSSSDRWSHDRATDKRSPRDDWSGKSNGRDDDRYGGQPRDDGGNRRFDRDADSRWNSRDGERKSYRRQDDGDSRDGGGSRDDNGERKPYRKRDDSGSRSSRDSDLKKSYNRDDRRGGGGGYRRNDDDRNRGGKSEWNGEKSNDVWSGKKNDSSWGGKKNDSDFGGRNNNSDWNGKKNDDWSNKSSSQKNDDWSNKNTYQKNDDWGNKNSNQKNDDWGNKNSNQKNDDWGNKNSNQKNDDWGNKNSNQKNDDWGNKNSNQKNDDWGNKNSNQKNDDWGNKSSNDYGNKRNDDWNNKKTDDWSSKKNDSDDWGSKKNYSEWKSKSSFDRDDRRPRRDNDYKPRDGSFNSRDGTRQRGGGYGAQNDGSKSTPALSDGYPAGSKIAENDFQVGQQMNVVISWFLNPVHFYLIPAENADFRQLMETIQSDYPQRKNAELNSLSSGDFVVARCKDNVIYRAKVIQTRPGGATVSFVDYGNNESVGRSQIWTISGDHCSQPVQAVCCGLYNISSTGEGGQWSLPADVEKYFGKEKYSVKFVECREETTSKTWFVNLADEDNQDIADILVADGFAVKNTVLKSEELYDIELLRDQILPVFPGYIDSSKASKEFYVHIEPHKTEMIQASIAALAEKPELLVPLPTEKIREGEFCLGIQDEVYYRAQILSVNEADKVAHIMFIDYGDKNDVAFDSIKTMPENLMIYNSQIFECCLHDAELFTNEEAFYEALNEKDFMIKVMDVIDNKLSVFVYDINGVRLPYPVEVEETVDSLCSLPILKACEQVFITHISADKVYLARTSDTPFISELCEHLSTMYEVEEPTKVPLEPGVYYAVKSKVFESWYRSILPSADAQEVYYIDYGNTEPVEDLLAVKPLDKTFFVSPSYCVAASTSMKFTCADLTPLITAVAETVFRAKFEKQTDGWYVDLKCEKTGKTLIDFATACECSFERIESKTDADQKPYAAFGEWQLNEERNVSVAHVISPNSFYLHLASDVEKISAIQRSLQGAVHRSPPLIGPVDGLCAAQKSDGQWCRIAVSDKQTVFAVDFGETFTASVIKKLPLSFAEDQSNYIVECSLNVKPIEAGWSNASVSRFLDIVKSGKEIVAKLEFQKSPKLIDLIVDGVSVGSTMVDENLAQWKCHEVIVSHANSLSDFYLQEPEKENDLFALAEKLLPADAWENVEPTVDDFVVAQYEEDQQWYRAVVVKIEDDVKYVRFIDYGNESACSQFRVLPDSFKPIHPFATKCTLHSIPESVDDLNETFINLVASADGSFTAYFLSRVEPMLVMLYYNNTAIEDVLTEKPAEVVELPKDEVPTESVVYDNVAVCHINSPSSFYVQSETAPLDSVATALINVENAPVVEPAVGNIVAALFPCDGLWYRAKVCDMTDGINVLFTDYGNSCIVEELRQLPENAQAIPALAKHCAFTLPAGLEQWPDIAKQRFAELTCEGNTIFKLNLLEEGDPAYVDLQDVGVNVADELATLCKADLTASPLRSRASESTVLLSHVESLNEIWIQFQSPQLDEMVDEMANAETFEAIESVSEGSLVAALFNDDGAWYRAKVIKIADGVYDILFIDYGNGSSTSSIKSLPADLVNLPALAKCCQLKDFVEVAESHVDAVVAKLKEFVDAAQTFVVRELVESDNVNFVSLEYENKDLNTEMRTFYDTLVTSTAPVKSQSEDVSHEAQVHETAVPVQDVDVTENAKSVDAVRSEAVAVNENSIDNQPIISKDVTDTKLVAVADDMAGVGEVITDKVEHVTDTVESKNESGQVAGEPASSQYAEDDSLSHQKAEKLPEKAHEVISSVASADDTLEVTETASKIDIAENIILPQVDEQSEAESKSTASENDEKVEEMVTPEKRLDDSFGSEICDEAARVENTSSETCANTPLVSKDSCGEMREAFDLTPEFKTPMSKSVFDAEDSQMEEATQTDEDSNPDHFESAVGPVDSVSPFSTPGDRADEAELVDSSMESRDDDVQPVPSVTNEPVDESTTKNAPPLAEPEKFDDWELSDAASVADQSAVLVNEPVVLKSKSQFPISYSPPSVQFADANETDPDELADLLGGMKISDGLLKTPVKSMIKLQVKAPPPKVEEVKVGLLIDLGSSEENLAQSKPDPASVERSEEVPLDSKVESSTESISGEIPAVTRSTCDVESETAVTDQPRPVEQMGAAKSSELSNSTVVLAQPGGDSSTPIDSPIIGDSTLSDGESCEVVEETTDNIAQSLACDDHVGRKVENEMESDSKISDVASTKQSDLPSSDADKLPSFEEPIAGKESDESKIAVVEDDSKALKCDDTLSETAPDELSDSFIAKEVAESFFINLVASAENEFNSTSNPFLEEMSAEDLMTSLSSSSASELDISGDSTSAISYSNVARKDIFVSVQVHQNQSSIEDDTSARADIAQCPVRIKGDCLVSDVQSPPTEENVPSLVVKDDSTTSTDVAEGAPSLAQESAQFLPAVKDVFPISSDDAQSPPINRDVSPIREDDAQRPSFVKDVLSPPNVASIKPEDAHVGSDLSLESFRFVPPKDMRLGMSSRPERSLPDSISSSEQDDDTSPKDNSDHSNSRTAVTAEDAPAVEASFEQSTQPTEEDNESLPSSGAAEVTRTLANACQFDESFKTASLNFHGEKPSKTDAATSEQSPNTTQPPELNASTNDRDDNDSVYFDSCAEASSIVHSDDDQQPKSFGSSTSDETSFGSGCETDEVTADLVTVSFVNTPGDFFVQRVTDQEALRNIEKQLDECKNAEIALEEVHSSGSDAEKVNFYGAEIDDRLFRVRVLNTDCAGEIGAEYTVCCIDYGRVCSVRKLFALPESLQSVCALATACSLMLPCYLSTWPVSVCHEFEQLVMTEQPKFHLKYHPIVANLPVVDLVKGSCSIGQRMKTLCEEFNENYEVDDTQGKSSSTDE